MTDDATRDGPKGAQTLAQFMRDWTSLWQQELQAQGRDPEAAGAYAGKPGGGASPDLSSAMDLWRTAMGVWAEAMGLPPASSVRSRDSATPSRSTSAAAAPDPRDAEIERLARRIDDLEARLAKLETPRRRRG